MSAALTVLFVGLFLYLLWWVFVDMVNVWSRQHDPWPFGIDLHPCLCGGRVLRGGMPVLDREVLHGPGRCQPVPEVIWS